MLKDSMMNKKILVTGATGGIGSHLVDLLVKKGFNVTAFDRSNTSYNLGCLSKSQYKRYKFCIGDIRDYDSVYKASKGKDLIFI